MVDTVKKSASDQIPIRGIYWFRRCLRLHDNSSLIQCIEGATSVKCVYFLDPWFAEPQTSGNKGVQKWKFLLESLSDLDKSLRKINLRLYVIRGQPAQSFPNLFKTWEINRLSFESDPEPFARRRDEVISRLAANYNVEVFQKVSHTLYDLQKILLLGNGRISINFTEFQDLINLMDAPEQPAPSPNANVTMRLENDSNYKEETYGLPTLAELGFESTGLTSSFCEGGESEALRRMEHEIGKQAFLNNNSNTDLKTKISEARKMTLGLYLRFGCLSSRMLYHYIRRPSNTEKLNQPVLLGHLIWREFIYALATDNAEFDKEKKNPLIIQMPWTKNQRYLKLFEKGRTGYPWIDAIMKQLRCEGWIHQVMRHIIVHFLTCGGLWMSWEEGCKIFQDLLLDQDWAISAGFWAWATTKALNSRNKQIYCPMNSGKKMDPSGSYICKYLPVLKNMPIEYIHEPWKAPISIQKKACCIIGKDYPIPMIDPHLLGKTNAVTSTTAVANYTIATPINKSITQLKINQRMNAIDVHLPTLQQENLQGLPRVNISVAQVPATIQQLPEETRRKRKSTNFAPILFNENKAKTLAVQDSQSDVLHGRLKYNAMHDITNTPGGAIFDKKENEKSIFYGATPHYTSAGAFPQVMVTSTRVAAKNSYPMIVSLTEDFNTDNFNTYFGSPHVFPPSFIKTYKASLHHASVLPNFAHSLPPHPTHDWTPALNGTLRQQQWSPELGLRLS